MACERLHLHGVNIGRLNVSHSLTQLAYFVCEWDVSAYVKKSVRGRHLDFGSSKELFGDAQHQPTSASVGFASHPDPVQHAKSL